MMVFRLLFQTVFLAMGQIWANKAKAILTTLGIVIGVSAVITVIAGLGGLRGFVLNEFETFGARKVWINGYVPRELRTTMSWTDAKIGMGEIRDIDEYCSEIELITPVMNGRYDVRYDDILRQGVEVTGIWPSWHEIEDRRVLFGREFGRSDRENALQVCLINEKAIEEFRLDADPTGDFLLIKGRRFQVVGVIETKEFKLFGDGEPASEVFIPYETAYNLNPYRWRYAIGQIKDTERADEAQAEIRHILRTNRNIEAGQPDTFRVEVVQNAIDQFNGIAGVMTGVGFLIAVVSLVVGGVGIMNIMLVSVSERTREIGLRKAVGARPGVILLQFLVEAVTLCLVGGVIGLVIGQGASAVMRAIPDFPLTEATVPPWAVGLAVGFCAAVGVVFGMFPAIKAAALNPIDALRHD